jgi:threonine/homoserine/homoserine lactone efflux protein
MPSLQALVGFTLVALGMALTPGPNMIYLVSRSITQGRNAALISLGGVALAFVVYLLATAFGLSAIFMALPFAYDALRLAGAAYLAYLAFQALRPGGTSAFAVRILPKDSPRRLFTMGFLTSVLNPKIALMYLSLLPQFIDASRGDVLSQLLVLGGLQIFISVMVNASVATSASTVARLLAAHPRWELVQRWLMGTVLGGLAVKMAFERRN